MLRPLRSFEVVVDVPEWLTIVECSCAGVWLGLLSAVGSMSCIHIFFFVTHTDWTPYCYEALERSQAERDAYEGRHGRAENGLQLIDNDDVNGDAELVPLVGGPSATYNTDLGS